MRTIPSTAHTASSAPCLTLYQAVIGYCLYGERGCDGPRVCLGPCGNVVQQGGQAVQWEQPAGSSHDRGRGEEVSWVVGMVRSVPSCCPQRDELDPS